MIYDAISRFHVIKGDITTQETDAIVNAANTTLLGGGGVDGAIHRTAGPDLLEECRGLNGCRTGHAKRTKGYGLPAKHVIHTPGPIWTGGGKGEAGLLESCYQNCLALAEEAGCRTVSFPSISTGVYRFPVHMAAKIAVNTILKHLKTNALPEQVYMVCFDDRTKSAYDEALQNTAGE